MSDDGIERDGFRRDDLVVVTGAGGGFGRAFAHRFARDGARLALWEINEESGDETARQVRDKGAEARFFKVDLADSQAIEKAAADTLAAFGTPYCVINNASIYPRASVVDMEVAVFEKTLKINIVAPFHICKLFGPKMLAARRGVVINIASGRALEGAPKGANYSSSKGAILAFTKSLALEWAPHNVRVNAIIPGVSFTAQPLENTNETELLARGKGIPMRRIGYPEDMAGLAAYLAGPDAAYMTGQGVAMNGGKVLVPQ
jgi:NAD(P)-dependent dehydrogenase (short-subunit alcohol dehydrogenase family)